MPAVRSAPRATNRPSPESLSGFVASFAQHHADVFRYALVLTGNRDDADDIAAETYLRAWRAWASRSEPSGPPLPWLIVIARNLAMDHRRRAARAARHLFVRPVSDNTPDPPDMIWLRTLLRSLPQRQREVVVLRYLRDLSDADIGQVMGLTSSGVRSLAGRAIAALRAHPEVWQ